MQATPSLFSAVWYRPKDEPKETHFIGHDLQNVRNKTQFLWHEKWFKFGGK